MLTQVSKCAPMESLLQALGFDQAESGGGQDQTSFRIEFDQQFAVELEPLTPKLCRVSARICSLGKSQTVQNSQILKAFNLYEEVLSEASGAMTLSISQYDNCLRLLYEFGNSADTHQKGHAEYLVEMLEEFASNAYAFKKTYFSLDNT